MIAVTLVSCPRRKLAIPCPACAQDEQGRVVRRHALCGLRRSRPDLAQLEKLEAEGLDLPKDAEHRGLIFKQAGEHGLTAGQLGRHGGKGGQSSRSEPTPYPDGVQAWRHATTVLHDWVLRRRRNPAIGARTWAVRTWASQLVRGYFGDVGESRLESSRNWRARCTAADRSPAPILV